MIDNVVFTVTDEEIRSLDNKYTHLYPTALFKARHIINRKADQYILDNPDIVIQWREFKHRQPIRTAGGFRNVMILHIKGQRSKH